MRYSLYIVLSIRRDGMSRSGYVYGKPSPTGEQLYPIRVDSSVTVLVLIEGSGMGFNDRAAGSLKPRGLTRWRLCCPHRRRRVRHDRGGLVAGGLAHPRRSVVKSYRRQRERGVYRTMEQRAYA